MRYNHEMMWKELKEKLYPRADNDGLLSVADLDEVMEDLENEWQKLVSDNSFDRPKGIKATEQPSKAAADKGILTEEELKERNRLLVLENDELNAEVIMLREFQKSSDEIIGDYVEKMEKQNEEICRIQDEISNLRGENQ